MDNNPYEFQHPWYGTLRGETLDRRYEDLRFYQNLLSAEQYRELLQGASTAQDLRDALENALRATNYWRSR